MNDSAAAIVLDGNQRCALAATRSLGSKGIAVIVGDEKCYSLASSSKYCGRGFAYPSPYINMKGFIETIKKYAEGFPEITLLPMTDVTLTAVLQNKTSFEKNINIPFVDYEKYMAVSDKGMLFSLARKLEIPIPDTLLSTDFRFTDRLVEEACKIGFPLITKAAKSKIYSEDGLFEPKVQYLYNKDELTALLSGKYFKNLPFIVQKRIYGPSTGIFLLMKDGDMLAHFAHKRLREKPPSGGVSVLCESMKPDPVAMNSARKILQELRWTGVAMVEFKSDIDDKVPKLIEVNARFWGSLQLAISAGIDFPYLLFCLANGKKTDGPDNYKVGLKLRWECGDLDNLLLRLFKNRSNLNLPPEAPPKSAVLANFLLDFFKPAIVNEIFRAKDPCPFLFELKHYIKNILK